MKRLIALALLVALPSCASAEARDLAAKQAAHLKVVNKCSAPAAGVDKAVWDAAWAEAHRAAANLEGALK